MTVQVTWAGRMHYGAAWEWQKQLVVEQMTATVPDRLLLLEHTPVYTLGRSGRRENLLLDEKQRAGEGIELFDVDRGGDITYHGPGQLVGYPILNLGRVYGARQFNGRPDVHRYLRDLEEILIQTLAAFNLAGWRYEGYTGVWVTTVAGPRKIAAIGIKVNHRGISSHGFALNVNPDLAHFAGIVPCGICEHGVTSMAQLLPRVPTLRQVAKPLTAAFGRVLQVDISDLAVQPVARVELPGGEKHEFS
jgi:lipoyl(octanoyl) transferase